MLRGPRQRDPRSAGEKAAATYLNDHLANATFARDLAARLRDWSAGADAAQRVAELAAELDDDRRALEAVIDRLDVARDPARQAGNWVGDKVSRLRLSASGDEPTGFLLAIETLMLGVQGNLSLWRTLHDVSGTHQNLDVQALAAPIARAESQHARLEDVRRAAATVALLDEPRPERHRGSR